MAFLSFQELFDIAVMSLVIGFIFKDFVRPKSLNPDEFLKNITPGLGTGLGNLSSFWYAVLLVAPSIILHEFGHKLTAMALGLHATFHAAYRWLVIGVILKLVMPGFIFFVPAYVSFPATTGPLQSALIAFAGPAVNGLLWVGSLLLMRFARLERETLKPCFAGSTASSSSSTSSPSLASTASTCWRDWQSCSFETAK